MDSRSVKEASVEGVQRRTEPKKHFVFCVKVTWSDGTVNLVYRRYSEFIHVQTMLFQAFPETLGRPGQTCSKHNSFTPLPDTFSSRMNVGEAIFRRMELVNYFLKEILRLDSKLSQSKHIKTFLTPTSEDLEPKRQPSRKVRIKKVKGKGRRKFSKTMKGRLQKFGKTKIFGNNISSPIVLERFVVMEDYEKQSKSDISLTKGKTVDVIEKRECGWWLVDADGEVGWAPALFLEPADEISDADVSHVQTFPIGRGEVFVTTKRYVAVEDDELTFDIGVNLQILEKNYDGWWKASYLGREGWVPQMYLKKLGNDHDRRNSKSARRKSRLFSRTELRNPWEEEEDEVIQEIPEIEAVDNTNKEDKKTSLPRKISQTVLSALGKKAGPIEIPEEAQPEDETDKSQTRKTSTDESKTIGTMVEMSSVFLQLHKPDKTSSNANPRPRTPETQQKSRNVSEPVSNNTRPTVQRRAISTLVASTYDPETTSKNNEKSKDDLELEKSTRPLSKVTQSLNGGYKHAVESKWKPEIKNVLSSSLPSLQEVPDLDEIEIEDESPTQLNSELPNFSNGLSLSNEIANCYDMEASATMENADDSDTGACDISYESTTAAELTECLDGFCKQPVDDSVYYKKNSLDEDFPKFNPPRRSPPLPSKLSQGSILDSPRAKAPSRSPPVPNAHGTFPRGNMPQYPEDEQHKNHTIPKSTSDLKIIRQDSYEKETAQELNQEIHVWCTSGESSDESEPELAEMSFNRVLYPKTSISPAIVVDELENHSTGEELTRLALDDDIRSTESFEIEINLPNSVGSLDDKTYSTDVYCTAHSHEVDTEMYLTEGEYVKVIERASTGFWLVQNEEGVRGWTFSGNFFPVPEVSGKVDSTAPKEEEDDDDEHGEEKQDQGQYEEYEDDENRRPIFCQVIEDYEAEEDNEEIDLREGEIMQIICTNESGWWCVQNSEREIGWAPSNYLEVLENGPEDIE